MSPGGGRGGRARRSTDDGEADGDAGAHRRPFPPQTPPAFDPFFGMGRDMGSFIGGMPLPLPAMQRPARPRPRLPFSDSPVTFEALDALRQAPIEDDARAPRPAEDDADAQASEAPARPRPSGDAGAMFLGLDSDELGDRFPLEADDDGGEPRAEAPEGEEPGPQALTVDADADTEADAEASRSPRARKTRRTWTRC